MTRRNLGSSAMMTVLTRLLVLLVAAPSDAMRVGVTSMHIGGVRARMAAELPVGDKSTLAE